MSEKDKLNLLSILESTNKILEYSKGFLNADEFFENQRDFDG